MLVRKHVVFTTFVKSLPAAASIAAIFYITCSACSFMPPETTAHVSGDNGICPDAKSSPSVIIAYEYGLITAGAEFVDITFMGYYPFLLGCDQ
ncbi:hypothetical protein [Treponema sp. R8-4-B8]